MTPGRADPPVPSPRWRAVLFDLDGTLLDTLEDIAGSVNQVLAARGFPTHPIDAYRHLVGDGVATLLARALPADQQHPDVMAHCIAQFRDVYRQNWDVRTRPYDGVLELLALLAAQRVPMAVLSNKPDEFTQKCVDKYLSRVRFALVVGQRDAIPKKPDPTAALMIAHELGVATNEFVYLGDTAVDMQTAVQAGMYPVGALWGFRTRQELLDSGAAALVDHPRQLWAWLHDS